MNKAESSHRWFAAWRSTPRVQEDDPADMGTAFGLDLSLNLLPHEAEDAVAERSGPSWLQRLILGRKPAV